MQLSASPAIISPLSAAIPTPGQPAAGVASASGDFAQLFASLDSGTSTVAPTLVVSASGPQPVMPGQVDGAGESQTGVQPGGNGRSILLGFAVELAAGLNGQVRTGPTQPAVNPGLAVSAGATMVESPIAPPCSAVSEEEPSARVSAEPSLPRSKKTASRESSATPDSSLPPTTAIVIPSVAGVMPVQAAAVEFTAASQDLPAAAPEAAEAARAEESEPAARGTPDRAHADLPFGRGPVTGVTRFAHAAGSAEPGPAAATTAAGRPFGDAPGGRDGEGAVCPMTPVRNTSAEKSDLPAAAVANEATASIPQGPARRSKMGANRTMAIEGQAAEGVPQALALGQGTAVSGVQEAAKGVSPGENDIPPAVAPRSFPPTLPAVAQGQRGLDRAFAADRQPSGLPFDPTEPMLVTDSRALPAAVVAPMRDQPSQVAPMAPLAHGEVVAEAVPAPEISTATAISTPRTTPLSTDSGDSRPSGLEVSTPLAAELAATVDVASASPLAPRFSRRAVLKSAGEFVTAAGTENIAEPATKAVEPMKAGVATSVKQIESSLDKGVTDGGPVVGTHVAKPQAFMPVFASTPSSTDASLPAQADFGATEAARWNPSAVADRTAPVDVPALATRAVEAVLGVADRFATGERSSVRLEFEVGGTELSVRVALRDHAVHAVFQTDSPELRAALVHEWQAMSFEPKERPFPFAAPVFQAGNSEASNQSALAGDFSRHSRDGHPRQSNGSEFSGWPGHAPAADSRGTSAAVAAPRPADHLPHSVHLHTHA